MATAGPNFPGTAATLANAGTSENAEAWVSPGNIVSDNATEATITAATYDSPDISQLLVASNFGFAISAASVDGITVEIDRRSIIAGSGADFRVQLATGTTFATLVGTNKAATATTWPSTTAVASYGGVADTWSAGLTAAQVNDPGFAVMLSTSAKIANADIGVDFIRVTITYTAASNVTAVPTAASLTLTGSTPTILSPRVSQPTAAALTATGATPTVATPVVSVPTSASLTATPATPTVTVTAGVNSQPTAASLTLTPATPTVAAVQVYAPTAASLAVAFGTPAVVLPMATQPTAAALSLTPATPTVLSPRVAQPTSASLTATPATPTVTAAQRYEPTAAALVLTGVAPQMGGSVAAIPTSASLSLTGSVPAVALPITVSPSAVALLLAFSTPTVALTDHLTIVPTTGALTLTAFAPDVVASDHLAVEPSPADLVLAMQAPAVTIAPAGHALPDDISVTVGFAPAPTVAGAFVPTAAPVALVPIITAEVTLE